jgi:Rrf2 family protein
MLSRTAEYAVRAVLALAGTEDGRSRPANEIADELGVPRNYLSKVLNRLAKRGLLVSERGPRGGFRLAQPGSAIVLADVVAEFDDPSPSGRCVLGGRTCDPARPCGAHERWNEWSQSMARQMGDTTVADFVSGSGGTGVEAA